METSQRSSKVEADLAQVPANSTVPITELMDYSNWSATVRRQMLQALERRQKAVR